MQEKGVKGFKTLILIWPSLYSFETQTVIQKRRRTEQVPKLRFLKIWTKNNDQCFLTLQANLTSEVQIVDIAVH